MTISVTYEDSKNQLEENKLTHRSSKIKIEENIDKIDKDNLISNPNDIYANLNYDQERKYIIDDNDSCASHDRLIKTYSNLNFMLFIIFI
jgi:hypothetical protein